MTSTVDDLINETRRHVYALHQGTYNFLTSTITDSATTLTLDLPMTKVVAGSLLSIDEELIFVKSVSGQVATIARGWDDSTAAAHTAGAVVEVQPRFPRFAIKQALLEEIRSWPRSLFRKATAPISNGGTRAHSLTSIGTSWYAITEVRYGPTSDGTYPVLQSYDVDRGSNTLYTPTIIDNAYDFSVTYTAPFVLSTFALATDVVATVGIPESAFDIAPYGAAWRLLAPREIKRTFPESQSEPRINEAVPVGSSTRTAAYMKMLRDQRIEEESIRLAATVPVRW